MKSTIVTLGHVLYAPSQYVIPVFQRSYRWEMPQWEKYWSSLVEIQQAGKVGNHFMGFLVFIQGGTMQPGQNARFHLIDGQQRLTTTSLLLAAIRNVAKRNQQDDLAKEAHDYYLVHPLKKGENRYRLLPKAQDAATYIAIVDDEAIAPGRMADALQWFDSKVSELAGRNSDQLRMLFDTVCQRLEFMCATLENENAYSIFKGLNSTGVPLGQSDLIRNFIFMHVHPDAQDEFEQEVWASLESKFTDATGRPDQTLISRFFRDVLMSDGEYVQPTDTFSAFEGRHVSTGFSPLALGRQLLQWARFYTVILGRSNDADPSVARALGELNKLDSSTTAPLLLSLFKMRAEKLIDDKGLAKTIEMLRGFIFRRFVVGETSRGYGQMFVRAIAATITNPVEALERFLLERGWPSDAHFIEACSLLPLYKRGYARELLEALERAREHKEMANLAATQIEHILPQTMSDAWRAELGDDAERVHAEWLHRPGNLTLTAYNQEIGNQPFAIKRARFNESNVVLTREVSLNTKWTEAEILARGTRMAEAAADIWKGPKVAHINRAEPLEFENTSDARLAFWSGFAQYLAHTHPELPPIEARARRYVRLKSGIPKVLVELRYKHSECLVAVDVHFHGRAVKVLNRFKQDPEAINAMVGDKWQLERSSMREYGWISLLHGAPTPDSKHWPSLYAWLGQKFAIVLQQLCPLLRAELKGSSTHAEKEIAITAASTMKLQQRRYWAELSKELKQRSQTLRPQKPQPQHWYYLAIGRSGIVISATLNSREDRIGVELSVGSSQSKKHFNALLAQKAKIEQEMGLTLDWQELPGRHMSRIAAWRDACDPTDEAMWPEYIPWMVELILRMESAFRARVAALD